MSNLQTSNTVDLIDTPFPKPPPRYTIADYLSWDDGQRWELINGELFSMSAAPMRKHQKLASNLHGELYQFLQGKPCELYMAPTDVYFSSLPPKPVPRKKKNEHIEANNLNADSSTKAEEEQGTVVQPDVLVVCDSSKLIDEGILGAPDFIAEVLSDSTAHKDLTLKRSLYETHAVKEYWIIAPADGTVFVYLLENGSYLPIKEYRPHESVPSTTLPGFVWKPRIEIDS